MPHFIDRANRRWEIGITIDDVRRVRTAIAVDLVKIDEGTPPLAMRLATDPVLVAEVIGALLAPKLSAAGITEAEFCQSLEAAQVMAAYDAFAEALTDFFQQLRRPDLALAVSQPAQAIQISAAKSADRAKTWDLNALADQTLAAIPSTIPTLSTPGPKFTTVPESSA